LVRLRGFDFTASGTLSGTGKQLISLAQAPSSEIRLERGTLPANWALSSGTPANAFSPRVIADGCDYIYGHSVRAGNGNVDVDTSVYRTNGAAHGSQHVSWKLVPDARASWSTPFTTEELAVAIGATGSKTVTVEVAFDNAAELTNADLWLELGYLGTGSGAPQETWASTRAADILATPANLTSSSEAWTGTGGWSNAKTRKLTTTVTVNEGGILRARVCSTKALTIYVDPILNVDAGGASSGDYKLPLGPQIHIMDSGITCTPSILPI
jgi:hypothetical protein